MKNIKQFLLIFISIFLSSFANSAVIDSVHEKKIGDDTVAMLWSSGEIIKDIELQIYLKNIGKELLQAGNLNNKNYDFFLIQNNEVNAFASWYGIIGINSGLMLFSKNESELASILAHEIAHVSNNHLSRFLEKNSNQDLLLLGGILASILVNNNDASQAILSGTIANNLQNQINYTREHEWEADRSASKLIENSQYNPLGLGTFFKRLIDKSDNKEFLRTHPLSINRVSDNFAQYKESGKPYKNSSSYKFLKAKLYYDLNKKIINSLSPEVINYSEAYKYLLDQNYLKAKSLIDELLIVSSSPHVYILAGRIYAMLDSNEFVEFFNKAYKLGFKEEANYYLAESYNKRTQFKKALKTLKVFSRVAEVSPITNILLSEIYVNLNNFTRSQFQIGESLLKQKRYQQAISFFNLVMNSTSEESLYQISKSKVSEIENQLKVYKEIN